MRRDFLSTNAREHVMHAVRETFDWDCAIDLGALNAAVPNNSAFSCRDISHYENGGVLVPMEPSGRARVACDVFCEELEEPYRVIAAVFASEAGTSRSAVAQLLVRTEGGNQLYRDCSPHSVANLQRVLSSLVSHLGNEYKTTPSTFCFSCHAQGIRLEEVFAHNAECC